MKRDLRYKKRVRGLMMCVCLFVIVERSCCFGEVGVLGLLFVLGWFDLVVVLL